MAGLFHLGPPMAADFGVTGEVVVTSEKAEAAFDRVGDKATQMANEVASAAGKAGQAVDGVGSGAEKSADKFTRAESRMRDAIKRSTQELQLLGKTASERLEFNIQAKGLDASKFAPYIEELKKAEQAQKIATSGLDNMGMSAKATAAAMRNVPAQFQDIIVSLQGGQAPMTVFLQQGSQLSSMFGGAGNAAKALGGYVLGLVNPFTLAAVAVGGLGLAYAAGSKEADGYRQALVLTGNQAGATVGQMQQMAQQIAVVTGSQREAAAALATFASSGKVGQENLRQFTQAAIEFSRVTGQSVDEVAKNFADLANDPLKATLKLNESMNFLTESIFRQIQSLQEQGRETEAANVAQKAYADTLNERKDAIIRNLGLIEKAWAAIKKEAGYAMDAFLDIGRSKTLEARLEKAQAALASFQGTLPGKRTAEQVSAVREFGGEEGLKREIAGLQELIENQRKSAQMERERAEAVKASGELAQGALKYETDLEKQRREVLSATEKYETALKNQNLTQEQRNRLEADYIKLVSGVTAVKEKSGRSSTAAADNKDLREQQRIYAELADVSSTYYNDLAAAQEQRAKGKIGEAEYVKYVEELIQKQPFAVAAAKAHAEAIKDEAKAAAASAKTLSAWYEVRERESQGLQNQINARREDVMLMGMSAEAVAEYTQAKYEQLAAEKEAYAAALESASFYAGEYAEAYKAAAEAARQQAKQLRELGALEVEKVSKGAAKKAADDWQKTADQINQSLTDALMRGFESGKDFAANMRDTVVNMFKTMVLRPIVSAIVTPVAGAITGALGLAGSASAGQGGAGGMGGIGTIASIGSMFGGSLMAGAGWLTGATTFGGALTAGGSLLGTGFAGTMSGIGMLGGALLPLILGASLLGSFDKSGTPHYGASATYEGGKVTGDEASFRANRGISGRYSANAQSGVNAMAMGAGATLDAIDRLFGGKGGFGVTTAYSDDSSDDPGFGSLRITRDGKKVVDWGDTRTSKWADKIFADGEEGARMYAAAVAKDVRDAMLDIDLPEWARNLLTEIGDNVSMEQLSQVVQQIGVIKETFDALGATLTGFAELTDDARMAIMEAAGGIEALSANAGTYYQNFYSDEERTDIAKKKVQERMSELGIDIDLSDPKAREKYRKMVEEQMAKANVEEANKSAVSGKVSGLLGSGKSISGSELAALMGPGVDASAEEFSIAADAINALDLAGMSVDELQSSVAELLGPIDGAGNSASETVAKMLELSGAFAEVTMSAEDVARAEEEAAKRKEEEAKRAQKEAYDTLRRAIDRDRKDLQAQASSIGEAINGISSAVDLLKSNARDLYGEVDSTQQMLAAQGMVYIEDALAGVRAGASVADYTGLSDAISAARGGIESGAYQSEFERQRDALVLAGQLSELGELGDMQLSVEERQLRAVNEQLEYLDTLAKRADDMVNGTAALTETVDTYFARLMALLEPEDTPDGAGGGSGNAGGAPQETVGGAEPGDSQQIRPGTRTKDGNYYRQVYLGGHSGYQVTTPEESEHLNNVDFWLEQWRGTGDVRGMLAAAKANGYTMSDIATVMGWDYQDLVERGKEEGIPRFEAGGFHMGGLRLVGERGWEVEATGPSRIWNQQQLGQALGGGNSERIERLVTALMEQNARLEARLAAIEGNTKKQADQFESYSNGGTFSRQKAMA